MTKPAREKINPNLQIILILGGVTGAFFLLRPVFNKLKENLKPPVNPIPIPDITGCPPLNAFRATVIKNQMDAIYLKLNGNNLFNYPDEVNVVLGYTDCEIKAANFYFENTYGTNLLTLIQGEWDLDGDYDSAETKLQSAGI
jgi:hypothetical protein